MNDSTIVLLIAFSLGLGLTGVMVLAWMVVDAAKAMRLAAQQSIHMSESSLKVLLDGMAALTKELEAAHEISGLLMEQMQKMWKRGESAPIGVKVRAYSKPLASNGEGEGEDGEVSPLSPQWRSPRMEEEIRLMEQSKEKEQWSDG